MVTTIIETTNNFLEQYRRKLTMESNKTPILSQQEHTFTFTMIELKNICIICLCQYISTRVCIHICTDVDKVAAIMYNFFGNMNISTLDRHRTRNSALVPETNFLGSSQAFSSSN